MVRPGVERVVREWGDYAAGAALASLAEAGSCVWRRARSGMSVHVSDGWRARRMARKACSTAALACAVASGAADVRRRLRIGLVLVSVTVVAPIGHARRLGTAKW